MESCVLSDKSAPQDLNSPSESPTFPCDSAHYNAEDLPLSDLRNCLTEFLATEDVVMSTCALFPPPDKNDISKFVTKDAHEDFNENEPSNLASEKCFSKCATFPPFGEHKSSVKELCYREGKQENNITAEVLSPNGSAQSVNQSFSRSISLPTPLKLVSAMKGCREKLGTAPRKLSVTWAPDVYDPTPTVLSHLLSNNSQCHHNDSKKYGKNKQRDGGKSSQGRRGKGKKKQTLRGGGSTNSFKPRDDDNGLAGFDKPQVGVVDFNGGKYSRGRRGKGKKQSPRDDGSANSFKPSDDNGLAGFDEPPGSVVDFDVATQIHYAVVF